MIKFIIIKGTTGYDVSERLFGVVEKGLLQELAKSLYWTMMEKSTTEYQ